MTFRIFFDLPFSFYFFPILLYSFMLLCFLFPPHYSHNPSGNFGRDKAKAAIDAFGNGILHWAAHGGQHETIRLVYSQLGMSKDDVNYTNDKGLSPLLVASFFGFAETICVLAGT